jgi:hypothetical protein
MIYAVLRRNGRHTLAEFKSPKDLLETALANGKTIESYERVHPSYAHQWVRNGREHETGLYVDGGKVRYARAMED